MGLSAAQAPRTRPWSYRRSLLQRSLTHLLRRVARLLSVSSLLPNPQVVASSASVTHDARYSARQLLHRASGARTRSHPHCPPNARLAFTPGSLDLACSPKDPWKARPSQRICK